MRIVFLLLGLSMLMLYGCSVDRREIARSSSPDRQLLATHIEAMGGGAAGFVAEEIYLAEKSDPPDLKHPVFNASHCEVLQLAWLDNRTLTIRYVAPCSISHFTNRWYAPSDLARQLVSPVEIILVRDGPKAT
jgi:hypothetical protein